MFCFDILRIFGENHKKKKKKLENLAFFRFLRRSVRNPHRGVDLRCNVGCLTAARPRGQNDPPSGTLRHSFATPWRGLLRGVDTVHREQISDFCFRTLYAVARAMLRRKHCS